MGKAAGPTGVVSEMMKTGGGLIILITDNITFTTRNIPSTINIHKTELQMVKVHINNTKHITIANMYISPRDSISTHYKTADTDIPHSVITGDVNAHSALWYSYKVKLTTHKVMTS